MVALISAFRPRTQESSFDAGAEVLALSIRYFLQSRRQAMIRKKPPSFRLHAFHANAIYAEVRAGHYIDSSTARDYQCQDILAQERARVRAAHRFTGL